MTCAALLTITAITAFPVVASFWSHRASDRKWGVR